MSNHFAYLQAEIIDLLHVMFITLVPYENRKARYLTSWMEDSYGDALGMHYKSISYQIAIRNTETRVFRKNAFQVELSRVVQQAGLGSWQE